MSTTTGTMSQPEPSINRGPDGTAVVRMGFSQEAAYFAWLAKLEGGTPILRLRERLDEGSGIVVRAEFGSQRDERCGTVKQVFRSGTELWGTLLDLVPPESEAATEGLPQPEIKEQLADSTASDAALDTSGEDSSAAGSSAAAPTTPATERVRDETRSGSAFFEIRNLNPSQRVLLAGKANRQQRQLLLRDTAVPVQMALLNNPRLETKELLEIAKNPQTSGGVLQRLATDQRFSASYDVQLALVKNPQTPGPISLRLVELMRTSDLRFLAKSQALRENVRKAALRVYLKRS